MLQSSLLTLQACPIPFGIWSFYFCLWKRWCFTLSWAAHEPTTGWATVLRRFFFFLGLKYLEFHSETSAWQGLPWTVSKPRETLSTLAVVHNLWQSFDLQCNFDIKMRNTLDILCDVWDSPAIQCCCCVPRLLIWRQLDSLPLKSSPKEQSCMTYLAKRWNWG